MAEGTPREPPKKRGSLADILVAEGVISDEQLAYAKRVQKKVQPVRPLLQVLNELGYVDDESLRGVLTHRRVDIRIGELLVELALLEEADLEAALALQREDPRSKKRLGEVLVEHNFIAERRLVEVLGYQLGYDFVEPQFVDLDQELIDSVPPKWCEEHGFVPLSRDGNRVVVAFGDPFNPAQLDAAATAFPKHEVVPAIACPSAIRQTWERIAGVGAESGVASLEETAVVDIVEQAIEAAVARNASDIHIEPLNDRVRIRLREDGVLVLHREVSSELARPIANRIKVMCGANITERRRHQDGRFHYELGDQQLDLRVSFFVTVQGETIVLRLLNRERTLLEIDEIGIPPRILERFIDDALERPSGVILVTGPTGSGKTSTLYSCINRVNNLETSIITAEDPVEYLIEGIAQCSIDAKIDLSFDETLRHIVRQDPDVIVIGEIRDQFSAETAIQAALTGRRVMTTSHAEDAIGGLLGLRQMNIEAFLIASTVASVVAQRLVRRVCDACAVAYQPTSADLRRLGLTHEQFLGAELRIGRGCEACRLTGYKGRMAIFELLILNEAVRDAIIEQKSSYEIRRISREASGLVSLFEDGVVKAARGLTTVEEIVRMLPRLDKPRPLAELRRLVGE